MSDEWWLHAAQVWSPAELPFGAAILPDKRHIVGMPGGHSEHLRAGVLR